MTHFNNELYAEQAVLGCLLMENSTWDEVGDYLQPNDFVLQLHSDIYRAVSDLLTSGKKADIICISQYLTTNNREDPFVQLCDIAQSQFTPLNAMLYAEIVKQQSIDRKMLTVAQEIIVSVRDQIENRLDYAQKRIFEVADQITSEMTLAADLLPAVLDTIDKRQTSKSEICGLPTGFRDLDKITHGLHGGDLIILAGRPSMGKTLLAMNIAEYVTVNEKKVAAIFSLEMNKNQLVERSLSSIAKVEAGKMRSGQLDSDDFQKITAVLPEFQQAKLFIDDRSCLSVSDVRAKSRRIMREYDLSLIVVDYISLMSADGENETLKIGNISRGLKMLARDLNVPVIAISQLNRAVEQRNNKRPGMADLRQSGAIEQDADLILFIYRDEVYNPNVKDQGTTEIIISKHRNGNIGTINLCFNSKNCRFDNYIGTPMQEPGVEKRYSRQQFMYHRDL
jgi:replicative DNA helicase